MLDNITLLGFDFGTRKIGVAVGQSITCTAQPIATLPVPPESLPWSEMAKLIKTWQPDRLVVGLPYNEGFEDNSTYDAALRFIEALKTRFQLPVETVDEHLTSFSAKRIMQERGLKPNKVSVDALAAMLILESWLQNHV